MVPRLSSSSVAGIVAELSELLLRDSILPETTSFTRAVMMREHLASTAMTSGIAFPHARIEGYGAGRLAFALGRAVKPIAWGDGSPHVDLIWLFAVPKQDAGGYLELLSMVARSCGETSLTAGLREAVTPAQMLAVLERMSRIRHREVRT